MHVRFLLGPAGSGKTFRCLAEIRAELKAAPDGPPLILLAPKQATFQLERQLLAGEALPGYSRLQILSFDRLAEFVCKSLRIHPRPALNEEGRVMVLRALLLDHAQELKRFDKSARRPGFAKQLSLLLAELQNHGLTAPKLTALAARKDLAPELQAKLHDLGVLSRNYAEWLAAQNLQDAFHQLDAATDVLRGPAPGNGAQIDLWAVSAGQAPLAAALWLDGFAEMTPMELDLLAAFLPRCERATLAFCLDHAPSKNESWLSIWAGVGKTYRQCYERLAAQPAIKVEGEILTRNVARSRFKDNPALAHLEAAWNRPTPFVPPPESAFTLPRLVACANPDEEATLVAREILKFVRNGGRYRQAAVLVRHLEVYQKPLERILQRHGIPFFLDRRESVAHHPLAEFTRSALRTVAHDWQHEDWFAALKAGFAPVDDAALDRLENEALARGWRGGKWRLRIELEGGDQDLGNYLEDLRRKVVPPFALLTERLASFQNTPTGKHLAEALREFWRAARVEETLTEWSTAGGQGRDAIHSTVWDQMNAWLENLELAFPSRGPGLTIREWLSVIEAALSNLTVGVIPPALDQVLIGAIDRSRNPDLKLTFELGLNEGVFPAAPGMPLILSDGDRHALNVTLGPNLYERLARERFFAYIACTRPSERLVLTHARADAEGGGLNPSPLITHLQRLFPQLKTEEFQAAAGRDAEHANDLIEPLLLLQQGGAVKRPEDAPRWEALRQLPVLQTLDRDLRALRNPSETEKIPPSLAARLFGPVLKTSVSRLEQFAACPFRFFVHSGLRAEERKVFELDFREQGSFQHDVLKEFHDQLTAQFKRWRDVTPEEARERIGRLANNLIAGYRDGLMRDSAQTEFTARVLTRALQDFIEVLVRWMQERYRLDPTVVEIDFDERGKLPPWVLDLGGGHQLLLRGRIDRVDLFHLPGRDEALCVVLDYKSSTKKLDPLLMEHGVQLQLLSYLNVLNRAASANLFGTQRVVPAGVFYVNLRPIHEAGDTRAVLAGAGAANREAYRHTGRFDARALPILDASGSRQGEQFSFRLKNDGSPYANSSEMLAGEEFGALLARVETQLREIGGRIFAGETKVDPYRKGNETPCKYCSYAAVCRIDPWTHEYRTLRKADEDLETAI